MLTQNAIDGSEGDDFANFQCANRKTLPPYQGKEQQFLNMFGGIRHGSS
jgi:hypothetical protein